MTPRAKKLAQAVKKEVKKKSDLRVQTLPARVGNISNVVNVPNRPGYIYAYGLDGTLYQAYSTIEGLEAGHLVRIQNSVAEPNIFRVVSRWNTWDRPPEPQFRKHGHEHSYGGTDPTPVWMPQFMWWKAEPLADFTLRIYKGALRTSTAFFYPGIEDLDLTSHIPVAGAAYVLVEIAADGTLNVVDGTPVDAFELLTEADIPTPTTGNLGLICAVALFVGQSAIHVGATRTDIVDLRLSAGWGGGGGSLPTLDPDSVVVTDADGNIVTDANFMWDSVRQALTKGSSPPPILGDHALHWQGAEDGTASALMFLWSWGSSASRLNGYGIGGTKSSPSQTLEDQVLLILSGRGAYDDGGVTPSPTQVQIRLVADGDWTSTSRPTRIEFWTTPEDSTTMALVLTIKADGDIDSEGGNFTIQGQPLSGGRADYGDGSDGDIVFDGVNTFSFATFAAGVYTLNRNVYGNDVTVETGIGLCGAGFQIFARGTFENSGETHNDGADASAHNGGAGGLQGFYGPGTAGGNGIASGAGAGAGTPASGNRSLFGGRGGRGAAAWLSAITHPGGEETDNLYWPRSDGGLKRIRNLVLAHLNYLTTTDAGTSILICGGGGGGGGAKSAVGSSLVAGGGGGGGGIMMIAAQHIINNASSRISCNGGEGAQATGTGANAGGGAGGGGGILYLVYSTLVNNGTIEARAGTSGSSIALGSTPTRAVARAVMTGNTLSGTGLNIVELQAGTTIQPAKNTLYMLSTHQNGGTLGTPSVEGWGLTWNLIGFVDFATIATPTRRLALFYAYGTPVIDSLEDDKIIVTFPNAPTTARVNVDEIQNATSTIVQNANNRTNSAATLTVTLAAVGSSNAAVYGVFARAGGTAPVVGAGFSMVQSQTVAPLLLEEMSYNDTTVDITWTTAAAAAGIAVEIQAIGAAEPATDGYDGQVIQLQN